MTKLIPYAIYRIEHLKINEISYTAFFCNAEDDHIVNLVSDDKQKSFVAHFNVEKASSLKMQNGEVLASAVLNLLIIKSEQLTR